MLRLVQMASRASASLVNLVRLMVFDIGVDVAHV